MLTVIFLDEPVPAAPPSCRQAHPLYRQNSLQGGAGEDVVTNQRASPNFNQVILPTDPKVNVTSVASKEV